MNYKKHFENWLTKNSKTDSNKIGSYLKAIELLEKPFKQKKLIDKSIYEIDESHIISLLYKEAKENQKIKDNYLLVENAKSYGESGFYSASLKSYKKFLIEHMSKNIIFFGAPGTGKSYKINNKLKNIDHKYYERVTFHPEYDHTNFVGGYRPKSEKNEKGEDIITYQFVPQAFTNIYERAWNDTENQYYLIIEEINRGNCAEIFGDIFQLLDRNSNYTVSPSTELKEHLEKVLTNQDGINKGLRLPSNLTIYATMNTSDQSLFPMDSAFKRRWDWEYIPICYDDIPENESFGYKVIIDDNLSFKWIDFIRNVNTKIENNPNLGMDKCIGNYFIKSETKEISLNDFINKAIFYLWNDVFKDEDSSVSIFENITSYEKFFPINSNGKNLVLKIIEKLNITIENK
ncbi:AAA family ATPase [Flavobacterium covae]|nr:AAA family ATPase [Flavobacterium covae]QYS91288.1 AAA family ATPase [Flavobacterium covae]